MNNSKINWFNLDLEELKKRLGTDFYGGLAEEEAKKRLIADGLNKIPSGKKTSILEIFLSQFKSPLIYILLFAALLVYLVGDIKDSLIILFVLIFNAFIGTFQEFKAQNALLALEKFTETKASVLRSGKEVIIDASQVVFGDIIFLREGEKVPADARLIEAHNLKVDESVLTGESVPVHKNEKIILKEKVSIQERLNMVFMGTTVIAGWAKACVVGTGLNSFLGKISQEILKIDTEIPLKKDIRHFSKILIFTISILVFGLFIFGIYKGKSFGEMFATVVALAVSIVPEGLPVLLTVVLAGGVWKMAHKNALVKKLQAVESLGQVKIIAVDKTGTLTKNELIVRRVFINNKFFDITGSGYEPVGDVKLNNEFIKPLDYPELLLSGQIAAFCSNVTVRFLEKENRWVVGGDPTEASFLVFGEKIGFRQEEIKSKFPLILEEPFDYKNKYHAVCRKFENKNFVSVVGAPERVLELSSKVYTNHKIKKISLKDKERFKNVLENLSNNGFRVVAFGYKKENKPVLDIKNIIFAGFYAIEDSLRPGVGAVVNKVRAAGIKVVMITGDYKTTALAIAREAGILGKEFKEANVLTGEEIDAMSEDALSQAVLDVLVFSRVTPEHKLKIIQAYRKNGIIVAMTGDGVNDAPSLVAADLGVAMGKIGTEVAKEASDIVLLDDNLGTIVDAIEEGRLMYKKIQKIILFLISTSLGELLAISFCVFGGMPNLLLPAQILWLNLVTDPFMATPLAFEDEKELLFSKFKHSKYLINKLMVYRTFLMGGTMALGGWYVFGLSYEFDLNYARTITLLVLSIYQWFNSWNCRFEYKSALSDLRSSKFLILATIVVLILQIGAIYLPFMQKVLNTTPLSFFDWVFAGVVAFLIIIVEEIRKYAFRRFKLNF